MISIDQYPEGVHLLCVGGPMSGRRRVAAGAETSMFRAFATVSRRVGDRDPVPASVDLQDVYYMIDRVEGVWLWRPVSQSRADTMRLLLDTYERAGRVDWDGSSLER